MKLIGVEDKCIEGVLLLCFNLSKLLFELLLFGYFIFVNMNEFFLGFFEFIIWLLFFWNCKFVEEVLLGIRFFFFRIWRFLLEFVILLRVCSICSLLLSEDLRVWLIFFKIFILLYELVVLFEGEFVLCWIFGIMNLVCFCFVERFLSYC